MFHIFYSPGNTEKLIFNNFYYPGNIGKLLLSSFYYPGSIWQTDFSYLLIILKTCSNGGPGGGGQAGGRVGGVGRRSHRGSGGRSLPAGRSAGGRKLVPNPNHRPNQQTIHWDPQHRGLSQTLFLKNRRVHCCGYFHSA